MAITNARDLAYCKIKQNIIGLVYQPGTCLIDKQLANEFEMSRTPIREAIMILNFEKLIDIFPQSGTFVAPIDIAQVELEQFTRCALEKNMLLAACERITSGQQEWYSENLYLQRFYFSGTYEHKQQKLHDLDNDFHEFAFVVNQKERLFRYLKASENHVERLRILSACHIPQNVEQVISDHEAIAKFLFAKNKVLLGQAIEEHLSLYRKHLAQLSLELPSFFK